MVGWHHQLNGHGFGWTLGVGDGQGSLACCDSWGGKESDTTERLNWTELLAAAAAAKSLQSCPTLWPHKWQPTRLPRPWDSPDKSTGVGCLALLQWWKWKVKSKLLSRVQLAATPGTAAPGSSVHGIFQARVLAMVVKSKSIYRTQVL